MRTKPALVLSIFFILLGLAWIASGVQAAPVSLQVSVASPTPGPDGRIIYIVKAGDNCVSISMTYGVTLDYLRSTNQLNANCDLREGQKLMFGYGGPAAASPTPGPSPIPTVPLPTPTAIAGGKATACVLVYNDLNGDGLRQPTEIAVAGAAVSLTNMDGSYSQNQTSVINPDPEAYQGTCFAEVPMGKYTVSAAAPEGTNPTSNMTSMLDIQAGDTVYIDYGVQSREVKSTNPATAKPSSLLGFVGAAFLVVGIGLGIYVWSAARKK